jgi:hypothetical protein
MDFFFKHVATVEQNSIIVTEVNTVFATGSNYCFGDKKKKPF